MFERMRDRFPAVLALLSQLIAAALVLVMLILFAQLTAWRPGLSAAAGTQAILAALIGHRLGLSAWWLPINLAFVPGILLVQGQALPGWLFLLAFLLLLLNWNSFRERVPLYLSGRKTQDELVELLGQRQSDFRFIDLGSGLGGTLCRLARAYPQSRFDGVETAPLVFLLSWLRCLLVANCRVRYCSLWKINLAEYDVVYCFLSPAPMPQLWAKACAQMQPGSWLISNSFGIPGAEPSRVIELHDWRSSSLLLWER